MSRQSNAAEKLPEPTTPEPVAQPDPSRYASPEQLLYATVMNAAVRVGFLLLVISFILYVSGVLKPLVPLDQVSRYWGLSAADYVKATGTPTGWGWTRQINRGDMLTYAGIVVLAGASMLSTLALLPLFRRHGEKAHFLIAGGLILVLVASAANLLH